MKIEWLGHASFLIETLGKTIITDPFDETIGYQTYNKEVDYATVSHNHFDHNAVHLLKGEPQVINTLEEIQTNEIIFRGIASYHDSEKGLLRGSNIIYKIIAEDINLVHLGDLGHVLDEKTIQEIGKVDILFIPVGGTFTVDAKEALYIVDQLAPKIIIPMHYDTPHLSFELAPVEEFTSSCDIVTKKPYIEISPAAWGADKQVILLDYLSWLT